LDLAQGVPDQDQGDRNGLRASAVLPGLRAPALRLRRFPRKPSPAVCPCAPSGSSSSYGKPGSTRLQKSWPRKQRQRQPKPKLSSRRASQPRPPFRRETLPIQNKFTRSPRRPRNPVRGQTKHSKLRDCKNVRHEGKARRGGLRRLHPGRSWSGGVIPPDLPFASTRLRPVGSILRVDDDLADTCRRSRARAKRSARPSDRRQLTKLGAL